VSKSGSFKENPSRGDELAPINDPAEPSDIPPENPSTNNGAGSGAVIIAGIVFGDIFAVGCLKSARWNILTIR
jgi:hypothetical protein